MRYMYIFYEHASLYVITKVIYHSIIMYMYMYIIFCMHAVVVGDQLTCKNIRGYKLWRASEVHTIDRLTWAHETPGMVGTI